MQLVLLRVHLFLVGMRLYQNFEFQRHQANVRAMAVILLSSLMLMFGFGLVFCITQIDNKINESLGITASSTLDTSIPDFFLRESRNSSQFFTFGYEVIYFTPFIVYLIGFTQRRQLDYFDCFNRLRIKYSIYQYSAEERTHIKN
jgi:hypothetical protein